MFGNSYDQIYFSQFIYEQLSTYSTILRLIDVYDVHKIYFINIINNNMEYRKVQIIVYFYFSSKEIGKLFYDHCVIYLSTHMSAHMFVCQGFFLKKVSWGYQAEINIKYEPEFLERSSKKLNFYVYAISH